MHYFHRVIRKESLEKKRKLNPLPYPLRFREQSRNRYFLGGRIGTSPHPRTDRHYATSNLLSSDIQASSLVSFSRVSSSLLLSLFRERERERVSLPFEKGEKHLWDDRGRIVDTDFGDRFSRYSRETSNGPRMKLASNRSGDECSKGIFQKPTFQMTCFVIEFFTTLKVCILGMRDKYAAPWILRIR